MAKVLVLYHSTYGHVETMANAIAGGARSVAGVELTVERCACPELAGISEVKGGSPWGAAAIAGAGGSRQPGAKELAQARFQVGHVATIAASLPA